MYAFHGLIGFNHVLIGNLPVVDTDSFIEPDQMRGRIKPHFVSCHMENGGKSRSDGPFSVGSGHMNGIKCILWIPQTLKDLSDGIQTQYNTVSSQMIYGIQAIVVGILGCHFNGKTRQNEYICRV